MGSLQYAIMRHGDPRTVIVLVLLLALGSCSYSYDLLAVAIDGRLAFIVDQHSGYKPQCIDFIEVSVDKGGPLAHATAGDDEALIRNGGVYWWNSFEVSSCENRFPIFYAQRLTGPPFTYQDGERDSVEAKPLRIGAVYEVSTSGDGAYGSGWFRISRNGRIENLGTDPTPSVVNTGGYDATDYANIAQPADEGTYFPQKS